MHQSGSVVTVQKYRPYRDGNLATQETALYAYDAENRLTAPG